VPTNIINNLQRSIQFDQPEIQPEICQYTSVRTG